MEIAELVKEYGVWAGLTIYLVWQNRKDYIGVCGRLNKVEDFIKDEFKKTIDKNTEALNDFKRGAKDAN